MLMRGEISGEDDVLIEGQVEGTISVQENCLTVGPQGQVKAEVRARQVIIQGTVNGNVSTSEKIEIRKTGHVVGDLVTAAIAIEEGAYFKGSINILRDERHDVPQARSAAANVAAEPLGRETPLTLRVEEGPKVSS